NIVIDALPTMEVQDSGKFNHLAGQAYALRAYNYWCLVNTYAVPYAEENMEKAGVILRTTPQVDIQARKRSTLRETYKLINEDFEKAEKYMEGSTAADNIHLLTKPAVWLLGSRIALFQENWDEVIRLGELFMESNAAVYDLNSVDPELLTI
ncbi:MAG: RagB/SusD family nutrient uptake outer membrane protein, partial [Butyricimonas paravirosa]